MRGRGAPEDGSNRKAFTYEIYVQNIMVNGEWEGGAEEGAEFGGHDTAPHIYSGSALVVYLTRQQPVEWNCAGSKSQPMIHLSDK